MARRKDYRPGGKRFMDGFDSFAANLGLSQDNLLAKSGYSPGKRLTPVELEDMYRTSWVVGRTVEVVAEDMVRCGVDLQTQMDPGDVDAFGKASRGNGIPGRLTDAIKWARLYGGALAVMLIDGQGLTSPLDVESITRGSFRGLYVLDRHQVRPSTELISDLGPMLGYPQYYTVNSNEALSGENIHHSRVIRFIGIDLPRNQRIAEQHWGASVVERVYDRILALDSATHGSANLLYKSFLRVIRVNRLRDILAGGGKPEQALMKMFTLIRQLQSNEGITLLDKEDEFGTHGWTFAGIYEGLQAFSEQISGGIGIPLVRLLGQSSKGFSTGESDLRMYYDTILTQNEDDLRPGYNILYPVLSRHLWGRPLPEGFTFEFRSLYSPTETEKGQIATADAQSVAGLHAAGIIGKAQSLSELRDAGRVTGRFAGITDEDIEAARKEDEAPPMPEAMAPDLLAGMMPGAGYGGQP